MQANKSEKPYPDMTQSMLKKMPAFKNYDYIWVVA